MENREAVRSFSNGLVDNVQYAKKDDYFYFLFIYLFITGYNLLVYYNEIKRYEWWSGK